MAEKTAGTVEAPVEAAAPEKAPVLEPSSKKSTTVTTSVWSPGKTINKEVLFKQATVNTRDAVPVIAYDKPDFKVTGTKAKQVDKADGTLWTVEVTYTPLSGAPKEHPVDLEKVIAEAKAGFGESHPGDPNFLDDDPK
jgi:hypothetical protein